jgi:hypothetical protein
MRAQGSFIVDNRHRQRLARRLKYETAFANWLADGGTLLTGPEPPDF